MKFRLIYDGPLQPSQRDPEHGQEEPLALHKHKIRRVFHEQLKELWRTNKFLSTHKSYPSDHMLVKTPAEDLIVLADDPKIPLRDVVADQYCEHGYRFLPLVRDEWFLTCELEILFLRRDIPGSVIQAGDIDNRIKTLIDSLRKPHGAAELRGSEEPNDDEDPFYCLLEDDRQVSSFSVRSDTLLDPTATIEADNRRARIVISVNVKPYYITMLNLSFT